MKRFHIHIAIENLEENINFYSHLFATAPSVQKSDYAKWMLDDPRVNFAISKGSQKVGVNHLGIQVENADQLQEIATRLKKAKHPLTQQAEAPCCYAKSDKYWVFDPQEVAWEAFHTLVEIPVYGDVTIPTVEDSTTTSVQEVKQVQKA